MIQISEHVRQSESIAQLAAALSIAQGAIKGAVKDSTNPHFQSQYADLASVWDAFRSTFAENGLAVVQLPSADGPRVTVTTILTHKSGEWIAGDLTLTAAQSTCQGAGSAITYARRYGLAAVAGVAPEDDDDGEGADGRGKGGKREPETRPPQRKPNHTHREWRISEAEQKEIFAIAERAGKTTDQVKEVVGRHGFKRTGDITAAKYEAICAEIRGNQ